MTFAVCLAVTVFICLTCDKAIKKYPQFFYIGAALLSVAAYCINEFVEVRTLAPFVRDYIIPILTNALFATAFWTVVMFAGALKNGSTLIKKLMPIRGELSIIAALLTVGHIIIYGISYLKRLFSGRNLTFDFIFFVIVAFILVLIMTPLTVISIKKIRKKFKGKTWKNIQRFAYVFYAMIYLHVILVLWSKVQRGDMMKYADLAIYTVIFAAYLAMRVRKYYLLRKKPQSVKTATVISVTGFLTCATAICLVAFPFAKMKENNAVEVVKISHSSQISITEKSDNSVISEISEQEIVNESTEISTVSETTEVSETSEISIAESSVTASMTESSVKEVQSSSESSVQASQIQQSSVAESSVKSVESSKNVEPSKTVEPSKVTEPSRTVEPSKIVEQSKTVEPSKIVEQSKTVEPSKVVEPSKATESSKVVETSKVTEPSIVAEPSKNMLYNDGTYMGQAYGYDGDIYVTVTVQGDRIINITARSEEFEPEYFEDAEKVVIPLIISSQNTNVDAVSGATFSSQGIMKAVEQALNSAKI